MTFAQVIPVYIYIHLVFLWVKFVNWPINGPFQLVLFCHFRPRDDTLGNSFLKMSFYARANVRITYGKHCHLMHVQMFA